MIDTFTIVCCTVIIVAFFWALLYIYDTEDIALPRKRQWIEQLPSLISTLGVLGTFAGITKGLLAFDTKDLDNSIPELLNGMKTAFFTSLFGMIGSMILNRVVSHKFDVSKQPSDIDKAAKQIVDAISANNTSLLATIAENQDKLPQILADSNKDVVDKLSKDETVKAIHQDLQQVKDDVEILKGRQEELEDLIKDIKTACLVSNEEHPRLRAVVVTATESINTMDNNIAELKDKVEEISETANDIKEDLEDSGKE